MGNAHIFYQSVGSSPGCSGSNTTQLPLAFMWLGRQQKISQILGPLQSPWETCMERLAPDFSLGPPQTNQQMEATSFPLSLLCESGFQIDKIKIIFRKKKERGACVTFGTAFPVHAILSSRFLCLCGLCLLGHHFSSEYLTKEEGNTLVKIKFKCHPILQFGSDKKYLQMHKPKACCK